MSQQQPTAQYAQPEPHSSTRIAPVAVNPVAINPVSVNLVEAGLTASHSGPQWAHECEDLDMTLLSWKLGQRIEPHINHEVDVVWIGVAGSGTATINGEPHELLPGLLLLIPKSCERGIESTSERFSYISIHRRRRGLMPT